MIRIQVRHSQPAHDRKQSASDRVGYALLHMAGFGSAGELALR
jgi:hypothetical protein